MGTWYWLDAAPPDEWDADIANIKRLGYDYLVLCWGTDMTLFQRKVKETRRMLEICARHGLRVYLTVWSAMEMFPHVGGRTHQQVDDQGFKRNYYNLWNETWRRGPYRRCLQSIARSYRDCPALRGYLFDDTFASVGRKGGGNTISYDCGDIERFRRFMRKRYGAPSVLHLFWGHLPNYRNHPLKSWQAVTPPRQPSEPYWIEWYEARAQWYEEWARDTKEFIAAEDPGRELFLLDGGGIVANLREDRGIDFTRVAPYFDVVMLYAMPSGFDRPVVDMQPILAAIGFMVRRTRELAPGKKVAFDFHVYQPFDNEHYDRPSAWPYPNLEQIRQMTETAARAGANLVDHYGYRIGNWRLLRKRGAYLAEVKTMLRYRTDLWEGIRALNARIRKGIA